MLRKSHLLASSFDPTHQLLRSDFQFFSWGVLMTLQWDKTVQFWEQVVQLPLPLIPDCPLCPVIAIQQAFSFIKHPLQQSQAFMWPDPATQAKSKVFTNSQFLRWLRAILSILSLPARNYASPFCCRLNFCRSLVSGLPSLRRTARR